MIDALLNVLFGCTHRKTTFRLTPGRKRRTEITLPRRTLLIQEPHLWIPGE
jgi:hypothetical protein